MTAGPPALPVEYSADPVVGWRANDVVLDLRGERAWLQGVHQRRGYGPETTAACTQWDHPAPAEGCQCGLHCWAERAKAERYRRRWDQAAMCRVELFGEVICHGDATTGAVEGYRGAVMRTLGVEFQPKCARCARPATGLGVARGTENPWVPTQRHTVRPICDRCKTDQRMSCADLAARLGTEVRFADAPRPRSRLLARFQGKAPRFGGATAALLGGIVLLVLGGLQTFVGESPLTSGAFLAMAVGALIVGLACTAGLVGRAGWVVVGALASAAVLVGIPSYFSYLDKVTVDYRRDDLKVARALSYRLPGDIDGMRRALRAVGATDIRIGDIDENRRAVRFLSELSCYEVGLTRNLDGTYSAAEKVTFPAFTVGECPLVYPLGAPSDSSDPGASAQDPASSDRGPQVSPGQEGSPGQEEGPGQGESGTGR